jgi:Secretion system C-terminal sorting domain
MKHLIYFIVALILSANLFAQGQIINVPDDQPTIQAAINFSIDGDTVLVADGLYYENINFRGKAITVSSWFLVDGDETHIDSTIINGSQPTNPDSGTVVHFHSGEDTTSVLYGLTITGGKGSYNPNAPHSNVWGAGGIAIESGAKIIYNKIIFNTVTGTHTHVYGGGILITPTQPVQIIKNVIANNKVIGVSEEDGGGGGIFCAYVNETHLLIADNIIKNNSVVSTSNVVKGSGGAIYYTHSSANPNIRNNLIFNNSTRSGGALKFADYTNDGNPTVINNTIINNSASLGAGAIFSDRPLTTVINSIIWGNTAPEYAQIYGNVIVEYSDIEGGWEGTGNIDLDPLFADTLDYFLSSNSPCVDSGNPDFLFSDIEDENNIGFAMYPALRELRNDMGAYGGNPNMVKVNLPHRIIKNCEINGSYFHPGNDTLVVSSKIESPHNQPVEVKAYIENSDGVSIDSLLMHDDGLKYDEISGDGIFHGDLVLNGVEDMYSVHVKVYLTEYNQFTTINNAASFTTTGPVQINSYQIVDVNDSLVGITDLELVNKSVSKEIATVTANLITSDSNNIVITHPKAIFGRIPPGESRKTFSKLAFVSKKQTSTFNFELEISSSGIVYWKDTLTFTIVDVKDRNELPKQYALHQNYPNPFNPSTTIKYSIPSSTVMLNSFQHLNNSEIPKQVRDDNVNVILKVYDILGREIATLVNQKQKPGNYEISWDASEQPSGVYFYKLQAGYFVRTKKMILLR